MRGLTLTEEAVERASLEELRASCLELLAEVRALQELISARTRTAVGDLRSRGLKFNGHLPYGLECDESTKRLRPSRYEKRLIAEVQRARAAGLSLRAIGRTLAERNFVNRKGKPLDAKQVSRILAQLEAPP